MSQLAITNAGVTYKDAVFAGQEVQNITHFLFCNVPGLVADDPIDLDQPMPTDNIVHSAAIERVSQLNDNAVVMSAALGYDVGDFNYNWYGVVATKADNSEVLIAVIQTASQAKTKTNGPVTGNYSVKSVIWQTANIAQSLNISLSTLPWQVADDVFVKQDDFDLAMADKLDKTATAVNSSKLEGKTKAQVVAEARSGLSSTSHNHSAADVGALDSNATAVNSAKLEGKTKAQLVSEARDGLSPSHSHPYLGSGDTAVNSSKLEGKTKAEVVAEARISSGLNAELFNGLASKYYMNLNRGSNTQDPNTIAYPNALSKHANTPNGAYYWHIITTFYSSVSSTANRAQIAIQYNSGSEMYHRKFVSGVWSAWAKVYTDKNLTVATIGALAASATAVNSSKLEGKTKAEVVAEARVGLSTNTHRAISSSVSSTSTSVSASSSAVRTAYNKAIAALAKSNDTFKLEGKNKAEVVAEARSGLSANTHRAISSSVSSTSTSVSASSSAVRTAYNKAAAAKATITKATNGLWRDLDTGFTIAWGYVANGNGSGDYDRYFFGHTFTTCYGVQLTTITTRNDGKEYGAALQTSSSTAKDSTTYTTTYFDVTHSGNDSGFTWQAIGYTA